MQKKCCGKAKSPILTNNGATAPNNKDPEHIPLNGEGVLVRTDGGVFGYVFNQRGNRKDGKVYVNLINWPSLEPILTERKRPARALFHPSEYRILGERLKPKKKEVT